MAASPSASRTSTASTAPPNVKLLIDGEWLDSATADFRNVVNPATQEVLARVPMADHCGGRSRGGICQAGLQELAQDADRRASAHLSQISAVDPRTHEGARDDTNGRAGKDVA